MKYLVEIDCAGEYDADIVVSAVNDGLDERLDGDMEVKLYNKSPYIMECSKHGNQAVVHATLDMIVLSCRCQYRVQTNGLKRLEPQDD